MTKTISAVAFSALLAGSGYADIPLKIGPRKGVAVKKVSSGVSEISVTGPSPHFWTEPVPVEFDPAVHRAISFEYFSSSGLDSLSLRYRQSDGSMTFGGSAPVPLAETWQPFSIDFSETDPLPPGGDPKMRFHFSLKYDPKLSLQIRNLKVRALNPAEIEAKKNRAKIAAAREMDAAAYLAYLEKDYPAKISEIVVLPEKIKVSGTADSAILLKELPVHFPSYAKEGILVQKIEAGGEFTVEIDRFANGPGKRDRALSRWRLESPSGEFLSPCRWPDRVDKSVSRDISEITAAHQKGLGGIPSIARPDHEIFELGIGHATVNFVLNGLISKERRPGTKPISFEGQRYFLNENFLRARDRTIQMLCEKDIVVTCILLVGNRSGAMMTHPEAEARGIYSMPNLKTEQGGELYRAALAFLTERYSTPERRISNWVIHNEIDQAGTWTNMGDQPLGRYLETYLRSARIVYHSARLYDPHARVFVSLTHHWNKTSSGNGVYNVRDIIDLFGTAAMVEGEFGWGVAYHPYPQSLRNPDTWDDEDITYDFDTPYITPKNIEVLPAYLGDRPILLSEQGFNTPTLSLQDQKRQVAGLIYLFRKLPQLPTIEAFHLHRYQDMPDREGGLRLGIIDENGKRKLGWKAYTAIGTDRQSEFDYMADELLPESDRGKLKKVISDKTKD